MTILFSISLAAFCALLWAAISVARHLRSSSRSVLPDRIDRRPDEVLRISR